MIALEKRVQPQQRYAVHDGPLPRERPAPDGRVARSASLEWRVCSTRRCEMFRSLWVFLAFMLVLGPASLGLADKDDKDKKETKGKQHTVKMKSDNTFDPPGITV